MSRNSRAPELQSEIWKLDARYDDEKDFKFGRTTYLASGWGAQRHSYLCAVYRTGIVHRKAVESLAVRGPAPENPNLCENYWTGEVPQEPVDSLEVRELIPENPNLWIIQKPQRGRPRKDSPHRQAEDLQCSTRHARRLLASGKSRERNRHAADVIEALQARKKRASLVRELKKENVIESIADTLDFLRRGLRAVLLSPAPDLELVRRWIANQGPVDLVLMIGTALGDTSFRYAGKLLGVSRATLYRKYGERLDELRRRARELVILPVVDLARMANMKLPKRERIAVDSADSAWEEQTDFRQRNERRDE